jgi:negative regulator of flagellin synthesis FlgM
MKINGPRDGLRPDQVTGGQVARPSTPTPAANSATGDEVRISGVSGALAQLGARLAAEGEFDQTRVDRIKQAITNGEYKVNAEAVADKLIQGVRDLLSGKV